MELQELPTVPVMPELVVTEGVPTSGIDLLGLRAPAEAVANSLLDGITTVTPTVRYLGVRAWTIFRYQQLKGLDDHKEFMKFVHKVESAIVFANLLNDSSIPGLVGPGRAGTALKSAGDQIALEQLVKNPAMQLYAGPSQALKLGWSATKLPGITRERGMPLAMAVDAALRDSAVPFSITADGATQSFPRDALARLGQDFTMRHPSGPERDALLAFILPDNPVQSEFARVATYCLILHLCRQADSAIQEADVLRAVVAPRLDAIPLELHDSCEGWARFVVRDMLVAVHEAAVSLVAQHIRQTGGGTNRRTRRSVLAELTSGDLAQGFAALGFSEEIFDAPIGLLCQTLGSRLGKVSRAGNINRWDGDLDELSLINAAKVSVPAMASLPLAWLLAVRRMEPGLQAEVPGFDLDGQRGTSRMGVHGVILPEVSTWYGSDATVRDIVAQLIARSVDQHLRIAWSRLAREPWKDVSVLASDGEEWLYCQDINSGRATSRLYQAINWLRQLGLVDDTGVTEDGQVVLETRLAALRRWRDSGE